MNKKQIENQVLIPMDIFLRDYVGVENEHIIKLLSKLTHREFKELASDIYKIRLARLPFDVVEQDAISCGDILMVADRKNNAAPYRNPKPLQLEKIIDDQKPFIGPYYDSSLTREEYEDGIDSCLNDPNDFKVKVRSIGTKHNLKKGE